MFRPGAFLPFLFAFVYTAAAFADGHDLQANRNRSVNAGGVPEISRGLSA
jgi:hypothetical protein